MIDLSSRSSTLLPLFLCWGKSEAGAAGLQRAGTCCSRCSRLHSHKGNTMSTRDCSLMTEVEGVRAGGVRAVQGCGKSDAGLARDEGAAGRCLLAGERLLLIWGAQGEEKPPAAA